MSKRYIVLYADEFDYGAWEGYCEACKVSPSSSIIKIFFDVEDVEASIDYDEDDEELIEDVDEYLMDIAVEIADVLDDCEFDDITDHSGYYTIKEFDEEYPEDRVVCVNKMSDDGQLYYSVYCVFEDETADWHHTNSLSVDELFDILKEFYYSEKVEE